MGWGLAPRLHRLGELRALVIALEAVVETDVPIVASGGVLGEEHADDIVKLV